MSWSCKFVFTSHKRESASKTIFVIWSQCHRVKMWLFPGPALPFLASVPVPFVSSARHTPRSDPLVVASVLLPPQRLSWSPLNVTWTSLDNACHHAMNYWMIIIYICILSLLLEKDHWYWELCLHLLVSCVWLGAICKQELKKYSFSGKLRTTWVVAQQLHHLWEVMGLLLQRGFYYLSKINGSFSLT